MRGCPEDNRLNNLKENFFPSRGGYKVGALRFDKGKEFMSKPFHGYLKMKDIKHQLTVPYQSFQNGAVDKAHHSIEEKARALLIGGYVPFSLWNEATSCAVYLINRTPTSSDFIPLCRWLNIRGFDLELDHLKVFGCLDYVTFPTQLRKGKISHTGTEGVMVGYDISRKAYHIFRISTSKDVFSNQVIFDENIFPLVETKHIPVKPSSSISIVPESQTSLCLLVLLYLILH